MLSGYINKGGLIKVEAVKPARESLLQLLVREAEEALRRKASMQRFIERFSQPYMGVLLLVFAAAAYAWSPLRALPLLLAGCPSAFIISSSVGTALTLALLARESVVVRGGEMLENVSKVKVFVLDKTGTLTLGRLKLLSVKPLNGFSTDSLKAYAGGAAKASNHPASKALAGLSDFIPSAVHEIPGKGLKAVVRGSEVMLGSKALLTENGVEVGGDVSCGDGVEVLVAVDRVLAGVLCLAEEVDEGVTKALQAIGEGGAEVVIASGDRAERVKDVAERLGIRKFHAGLDSEGKKELIKELRLRYGKVGFVGDGINDVEAIAEADVGVVIGRLEAVSNIGDAVLMKGFKSISKLLKYGRRYIGAVRTALTASLIVKALAMGLGIGGVIPLYLVVGVGDDGTTLLGVGVVMAYLLKEGSNSLKV